MSRTLPLLAALLLGALGTCAAPASAANPKPRDFELTAPSVAVSGAGADREYVSPPLRAPKLFNVVGLRWRGPGEYAHLRVRVRRDGGRWTQWRGLEGTTAERPDGFRGGRGAPRPSRAGGARPARPGQ